MVHELSLKGKTYCHRHPVRVAMIMAAILPMLITLGIYIYQGVYPFGNETIFTVDLGQQYVDFYEYYRHALLEDPSSIPYSFSKGYGGEMAGTWTYYLMSPFSLILLLFPRNWLSVAVWMMVLGKIGASGMAFQYLLSRKYEDANWQTLIFSTAYALMGYTSANQLNVMWLDALYLLPLVIWGVERIAQGKSGRLYIFWLAILMIVHYYMAYMVCLFLILYFIYAYFENEPENAAHDYRRFLKISGRFIVSSLLACGLAAIVLLPTLYSLSLSKGAGNEATFEWEFAYPYQDLLSKTVIGAFDFEQMPDGLPNIFVASIGSFTAFLFFFQKRFQKKEKAAALFVLIVLLLSMNLKAFNIVWHGFQYPIWYPYRYSYVFSFFLLYLGYRAFRQLEPISLPLAIVSLALITGVTVYLLNHVEDYSYLTTEKIAVTFIFSVATLLALLLRELPRWKMFAGGIVVAITLIEVTANSGLTLTSVSYLDNSSFVAFIDRTSPVIESCKPEKNEFYRIAKSFQRTKNDAMLLDYYDLSHFNSTLERSSTELFNQLGLPTSEGFINYTSGTLLTDSLFNVRYYLEQRMDSPELRASEGTEAERLVTRQDLNDYPVVKETDNFLVHENPNALSLGFTVPSTIQEMPEEEVPTVVYQDRLISALMGEEENMTPDNQTHHFKVENYQGISLENATPDDQQVINTTFSKDDKSQRAYINLEIFISSNDAYYLTVPSNLNEEQVKYYLDGEPLGYDKSYRSAPLFNIADNEAGATKTFTIEILSDDITIDAMNLYSLDQDVIKNMTNELRQEELHLDQFKNNEIGGTLSTHEDGETLLLSIPYDKGWSIRVDGQKADSYPLLNGGMTGVEITGSGDHSVQLVYHSPALKYGIILSLLSFLLLLVTDPRVKNKGRKLRNKV